MKTPVIPALGRLRQEDYKFEANWGYIMSQDRMKDGIEEERKGEGGSQNAGLGYIRRLAHSNGDV